VLPTLYRWRSHASSSSHVSERARLTAACDPQAEMRAGTRSVCPVRGTRCQTVHRPIAGVSTDDQAVSDADRHVGHARGRGFERALPRCSQVALDELHGLVRDGSTDAGQHQQLGGLEPLVGRDVGDEHPQDVVGRPEYPTRLDDLVHGRHG
jgi:hypothetical protein